MSRLKHSSTVVTLRAMNKTHNLYGNLRKQENKAHLIPPPLQHALTPHTSKAILNIRIFSTARSQ